MEEIKNKIENGSLFKLMIELSIPSIIGFVLFGINNLLDAVFVGAYLGSEAFMSLTLAYPITQMLTGISAMIGTGAASLISLKIGSGEINSIKSIFNHVIFICVFLGLITSALGVFFSNDFIRLIGGNNELIVGLGADYLKVFFWGSILSFLSSSLNLMLRGEGKMKEAMMIFATQTALNLILTPLFIKFLGLGVVGAAWSTNIAIAIGALIHLIYFWKFESYQYELFNFNLKKEQLLDIFKLGFPSILLNALILIQYAFIINVITNIGGDKDVVFFGAINRILMFVLLPIFGMSKAFQPIVGVCWGSENRSLLKKSFLLFYIMGIVIAAILFCGCYYYSNNLLRLILPEINFSKDHLYFYYLSMGSLLLFPAIIFIITLFQSIGQSYWASVLLILKQIVVFIPVVYLLANVYGLIGLYSSFIIVDVIVFIFAMRLIYRYVFSGPRIDLFVKDSIIKLYRGQ